MAPRKNGTAARRVSYDPDTYPAPVWPKSLDGQPPFLGNPEFVRAQNNQANADRFERLLDGIQALDGFEEPAKPEWPEWDPPEIEDRITDLDLARDVLEQTHEPRSEVKDWDEARVWREMYLREYEVSDKLRQIAQNLDDKLDEGVRNVEEHNAEVSKLAAEARRLQLDLGL